MSCRRKGGISITLSAVQIRINQSYGHYKNIYDSCDETLGMLALAGCVSQAPSYASITNECEETVGMYALAGCTGTIPAIVDDFSGETFGLVILGG